MTDLEIIKKCAEKMGIVFNKQSKKYGTLLHSKRPMWHGYNPMINDEQCFVMVKRFKLLIGRDKDYIAKSESWGVSDENGIIETQNINLNRAICECVAKLP